MAGIEFDMSEVRMAIADMSAIDTTMNRHAFAVVDKGANNIKNQLREDMQASEHFKGAARSITYDTSYGSFSGSGAYEAEIGPESGPGNAGALANIAYFGTSRGGGTVRNPEYALAEEIPRFEKAMLDMAVDAIF